MSSPSQLHHQICQGTELLGFSLPEQQTERLTQYVALLAKWNKTYNLTAVRDPVEMVSRHILDSLSITPYVKGDNILDVGSGPGLPGIPLAIMYPERQVTTLDSNGKKTRFMTQAKLELGLNNLTVVNARVEAYMPEGLFDEITSRAFSSLLAMVQGTKHLLRQSGVYLAMKGLYPEEELTELTANTAIDLVESILLQVPGSEGERHLVILRNK